MQIIVATKYSVCTHRSAAQSIEGACKDFPDWLNPPDGEPCLIVFKDDEGNLLSLKQDGKAGRALQSMTLERIDHCLARGVQPYLYANAEEVFLCLSQSLPSKLLVC